jgi:two-component system response regulator AtoC
MPAAHILVVEDRESLRRMLERALQQEGYEVTACADGEQATSKLAAGSFDLVLTDLKLPGMSGIDVLRNSREAHPRLPVVVLTAFGTVGTAVEAMKLGAADFLEKPVEIEDLFQLVESLLGEDEESAVFKLPGGPTIIGRHPTVRAALRLLDRVAKTNSTVLLTGESGTGKELFARALHGLSARKEGPFVGVNCAAIPETLLENELFGHEKGAFTGAHRRQVGRFEAAHGGTLLLDEIGELPLRTQSKVLRVLEERTFERVGSSRSLKADVRLVAATNRDLRSMVEAGGFRDDLYYRLEVFPIELPPLRDRASDIPLLAQHLVEAIAVRLGVTPRVLTSEAAGLLEHHEWPGNVRQLANVLERAMIVGDGPRLEAAELKALLSAESGRSERQRICDALDQSAGDKHRAAQYLGMSYRTLLRRIKEHDLAGYPEYRSRD